jgi:hypothetical protein
VDLTGCIFGRLAVLRRGRHNAKHLWWICKCSCSKQTEVRADSLRAGTIRSCGCLHREISSEHGYHHLPGEIFGRLTVIRDANIKSKKRGKSYVCRCRCRRLVTVNGRHLRSGESKSCGCRFRDLNRTFNYRHGQSHEAVYAAYYHNRALCRNPQTRHFECYGGRGIEFRFDTFTEFYASVGDRQPGCWLMRVDSDSHFEHGNLQWIPRKSRRRKQSRKTRGSHVRNHR